MSSSSSEAFVPSSVQVEEVTSLLSPPTSPVLLPAFSGEPLPMTEIPVESSITRRRLPDWGRTPIVEHQISYPSASRSKLPVRRPRGRYAPQGRVASNRPTIQSRNPPPPTSSTILPPQPLEPANRPTPPHQSTRCSICHDTSKSNAFVKCQWCADSVVHSFCIPDLMGRRRRFWLCDVCVESCAALSDDCHVIPDPPPPPAPTNPPPPPESTRCSICHDTSKSNAFVECNWCKDSVVHSFCIPNFIGRRKRFWLCDVCVASSAVSSDDCMLNPDD